MNKTKIKNISLIKKKKYKKNDDFNIVNNILYYRIMIAKNELMIVINGYIEIPMNIMLKRNLLNFKGCIVNIQRALLVQQSQNEEKHP